MSTEPSALTAAIFHLVCAAIAATAVCTSMLWYAILTSSRRFRGAIKDGGAVLRSKIKDP